MAGRERQPDKYAGEGFLIYEYKNILNLNGKSSFTQNILHEKSLQHRYFQVVVHLAIMLIADGLELIILNSCT